MILRGAFLKHAVTWIALVNVISEYIEPFHEKKKKTHIFPLSLLHVNTDKYRVDILKCRTPCYSSEKTKKIVGDETKETLLFIDFVALLSHSLKGCPILHLRLLPDLFLYTWMKLKLGDYDFPLRPVF